MTKPVTSSAQMVVPNSVSPRRPKGPLDYSHDRSRAGNTPPALSNSFLLSGVTLKIPRAVSKGLTSQPEEAPTGHWNMNNNFNRLKYIQYDYAH